MRITDVKVKLAHGDEKLLAFASVTFDNCFVVRDIKVIQGATGLFVAMPSRKITDRCSSCGAKNLLQSRFCGHCGTRLPERRGATDTRGRSKFHADIAHPINSRYRKELQEAILKCYQGEISRSKQPGYVPANLEETDAGNADASNEEAQGMTATTSSESTPPQPHVSPPEQADAPAADEDTPPPPQQAKGDGAGMGIFA